MELQNYDPSFFAEHLDIAHRYKKYLRQTIYQNENRRTFDYYSAQKLDVNMIKTFFDKKENEVINDMMDRRNVKIFFRLEVQMNRIGETDRFGVYTKTKPLLVGDDKREYYRLACNEMIHNLQNLEMRGSGWRFNRINHLTMHQARYRQYRGGSYFKSPKFLRGVLNIENKIDNACLLWCILAHFFLGKNPELKHPERTSNYKKIKLNEFDLNFTDIKFPIEKKDLKKIEKLNNLAIFIHTFKGLINSDETVVNEEGKPTKEIIPYYLSERKDVPKDRIVRLFLLNNIEGKSHYCLIRNMSALYGKQISSHKEKKFICDWCTLPFNNELFYKEHLERCTTNDPMKYIKPTYDYVEFKHIERSQKCPYTIYADFEALIYQFRMAHEENYKSCKCVKDSNQTCLDKYCINKSWTEKVAGHVATVFYAVVVDQNKNIVAEKLYRGYNAAEKFNEWVISKCDELINSGDKKIKKLTKEEDKKYQASLSCPKCLKVYSDFNNQKVRDHDHWTGEYRGPLCNNCNLQNRKNKFIPVFFHNLKGYDSHHVLGAINSKSLPFMNVKVIPNNSEKYISFSFRKLRNDKTNLTYDIRFVDSFAFMSMALEALGNNLSDAQMPISQKYYGNFELFKKMRRKGVYPYEYMDCMAKYDLEKFPLIEEFYDRLHGKTCSMEDYEYGKEIFKYCKNMGEYTDKYCINDVLLLADVFENFRDMSLKNYELDPCWYYTAPGLAWDAMLKITKIKLQTIKDYDMYMFIEKGIRGGMVNAVKRYAKANNKYMKNYDSNEISKYNKAIDSVYLMYFDANNLYGWAMIQKLPYDELKFDDNFRGVETTPLKEYIENLNKIGKGCILEVDLEYPKELHDKHKDFPFCPENAQVNNQKCSKLMNMVTDKNKYIIHYTNLLQALDHGLKLKKIHKILTFKESNWMEPYIMKNTNLRKKAKNDFEKDFFKLMNNAVFGKTMENIRNRVDIRLITDENKLQKYISQPHYKRYKIINYDLVSVEMEITKMEFNKPIYVGFSILDISKTLMYEFHYNIMKKRYNDKCRLKYQDTDSGFYEIETEDLYKDLSENGLKEHFDFSDYPENHPLYSMENKKVIGKFKDELNGNLLIEHYGLKCKQYYHEKEILYCQNDKKPCKSSNIYFDEKGYTCLDCSFITKHETKISKGTVKNIVKSLVKNDYGSSLFEHKTVRKIQHVIQSKDHVPLTLKQNKVVLNEDQNTIDEYKRYVLPHEIETFPEDLKKQILDILPLYDTLPYGHYKIKMIEDLIARSN